MFRPTVTAVCNASWALMVLVSRRGKISKEKSFDSIERQYCIDLPHVILVTGRVIRGYMFEKTGVPQRTTADLRIFENPIYIGRQLPLKPDSVGQILVQPGNSQG